MGDILTSFRPIVSRILVTAALLLLPLPGFSQETGKEPNIIVYSRGIGFPEDRNPIPGFNSSISKELRTAGVKAVIIEEETGTAELLETAGWLGAFFLVECRYVSDGREFLLELNAFSTWDGRQIAGSSAGGNAGEEIDLRWPDHLADIILTIKAYLQIIEEENLTTESELAGLSERDISVAAIGIAATESGPAASAEDAAGTTPEAQTAGGPGNAEEAARMESGPFYAGVAAAPLIAVGAASDLFKAGLDLSISGGYTLGAGFGEIEIGGIVGGSYFYAEGVLVSSENRFLYFGPDVGLSIGASSGFRLIFGAAGGLNVAFVEVDNGERQTLFSGFLTARFGGRYEFNHVFSVSLTTDYTVVFLPSTPLTAIKPTAGMRFRF